MVGFRLDGLQVIRFLSCLAAVFFPRHGSAFQKIRRTTPVRKLPALLISVRRYALRLPLPRVAVVAGAAGAGAGVSSISDTNRVGFTLPGRK